MSSDSIRNNFNSTITLAFSHSHHISNKFDDYSVNLTCNLIIHFDDEPQFYDNFIAFKSFYLLCEHFSERVTFSFVENVQVQFHKIW